MRVTGTRQLKARLVALRDVPLPAGRRWTKAVVDIAKPLTPVRTGATRRSFRRRTNRKHALVTASYVVYFIDAGPKRHEIRPKTVSGSGRGGPGTAKMLRFEADGRTIFAKRVNHPGYRARPYRQRAADQAARRMELAGEAVALWNGAA